MKDAFEKSAFNSVDTFYISLFNLLKNSGAIKSDIKSAVKTLDINFHALPKMTGTRFVSHRRSALTNLLNMWPAIITALENTIVVRKHKPETKAKIQGFLKQLKSYPFLCTVATYLDILEKTTPTSLVFEGDGLLPFEVKPTTDLTVSELEDLIKCSGSDEEELSDSHLSRFQFATDDEGVNTLSVSFAKPNNMLRKSENREYKVIDFENFTQINVSSMLNASEIKKSVAQDLILCLRERFASFDEPIFANMEWYDPTKWIDDINYGKDQTEALSEHFKVALSHTTFNLKIVFAEWKNVCHSRLPRKAFG